MVMNQLNTGHWGSWHTASRSILDSMFCIFTPITFRSTLMDYKLMYLLALPQKIKDLALPLISTKKIWGKLANSDTNKQNFVI